ncbi:MAG TPA: low-specificity L-threonine aldolase [Ktedonobacteraceae bacterium]|jgi:threonine aldolase|nr:low-specificity L-threonine aldolase [Ktedonobacteraceae bacterium]
MTIDLRSDTVTLPSPAMREAMYRAEVGDDVYEEDPTLNRLQEMAASMLGKEAALFVPSGTMGNTLALLTHADRGQAVIVGSESHIYHYENGSASTLGGSPMTLVTNLADGTLDLEQLRATIADDSDDHTSPTALVCIENTHNRCGGTVLSVAQVAEVADLAHAHKVLVHMDGARIFNAAVALGVPVSELAAPVDSVMFCISKGLSAPVGSLVVGSADFIHRARRTRKLLGGGMRQAGILAAAGIVALEQMVERLADDHQHCKQLALGLAELPHIQIQPESVVSNILVFQLSRGDQRYSDAETQGFLDRLRAQGVLLGLIGAGKIRAVTHYGIEAEHISTTLSTFRQVLRDMQFA